MKRKLMVFSLITSVSCLVFGTCLYYVFQHNYAKRDKTLKIGIVIYRKDDEFIASMQQSMEEEVQNLQQAHPETAIEVRYFDAKNSQAVQNDIIENMIMM